MGRLMAMLLVSRYLPLRRHGRLMAMLLPAGGLADPDPAPWDGLIWGTLADARILVTDCGRGWRNRMSELMLFRENMRFRLAKWTKSDVWAGPKNQV